MKNIASINTTQSGYNAAISAPKPLEICFNAIVAIPLAETNMSMPMKVNHPNCLNVGKGCFFIKKKNKTYKLPPMNCRMLATSNAGVFCTPILLATQVVPQIMLVAVSAI